MSFELPPLPYAKDALEPHMSSETLEYHHGKHHATYVKNLNDFVEKDSSLQGKSLEELIRSTSGAVFNNAAQVWNHTFFWQGMSPDGGKDPSGKLLDDINSDFGSVDKFKEEFAASAAGNFGSGWTWLVRNAAGKLEIVNTDDADTPVRDPAVRPLLTIDVWEHAYYIDHRNARPKYIETFWKLVNWDFVAQNDQ